jgi:hypothetical protein
MHPRKTFALRILTPNQTKNKIHLFVWLGFACLLLLAGPAQSQNSLEAFYAKGKTGYSGVFSQDTTMWVPIVNKEAHIKGFYEIWWKNSNEVYVLQHQRLDVPIDGSIHTMGTSQLCTCNAEEANWYFDRQVEIINDLKNKRFRFGGEDISFSSDNCIFKKTSFPIAQGKPQIQQMLRGEFLIPTVFEKDILELKPIEKAGLLRALNGSVILDLEIELPDGFLLEEIDKEVTELYFIKSNRGTIIYPSAGLADWKKPLIKSGNFAQGLYNENPNNISSEMTHLSARFRDDQHFNALFFINTAEENLADTLFAKGNLILKAKEKQQDKIIKIPFDLALPTHLIEADESLHTPQLVYFFLYPSEDLFDQGLSVEYQLDLKEGEHIRSIEHLAVVDGMGNDLMKNQEQLVESINKRKAESRENGVWTSDIEHWVKKGATFKQYNRYSNNNGYKIKLKALRAPNPKSDKITLTADVLIETASGDLQRIKLADELSINQQSDQGSTDQSYTLPNALKPSFLQISTVYNLPTEGLLARFKIPPGPGRSIFKIDADKSKILSFKDENGNDLIARHYDRYEGRFQQNKRIPSFSSDKTSVNAPPDLSAYEDALLLHFYALPVAPAQKAFAEVDITYYDYNPSQVLVSKNTIEYNRQEQISIQIEGQQIQLDKNRFTEYDQDVPCVYYKSSTSTVQIQKLVIKDRQGKVLGQTNPSRFPGSSILIPESIQEGPLLLEVHYCPTTEQHKKMNLEFSLDVR